MAEEDKCQFCELVVPDEYKYTCLGDQCPFNRYFSLKSEFEMMIKHYGCSLLMETMQHMHDKDSPGLALWMRRKLVDVTVCNLKEEKTEEATPHFNSEPSGAASLSVQSTSTGSVVTIATQTSAVSTFSGYTLSKNMTAAKPSNFHFADTSKPSVVVSRPYVSNVVPKSTNPSSFSLPTSYLSEPSLVVVSNTYPSGTLSSTSEPSVVVSSPCVSNHHIATSSVSQQGFASIRSLTSSEPTNVNNNPTPNSSMSQVDISSEAMLADLFPSRIPTPNLHSPSSSLPPAHVSSPTSASTAQASPTSTPSLLPPNAHSPPAHRARKARRTGVALHTWSHGPVLPPPPTLTGHFTRSQSQNRPPRAEQRNFVEEVVRPQKRKRMQSAICNPICDCRRRNCICFQARERANI